MSRIVLFYNRACDDCARQAKLTEKLDWLNSVDVSTETPLSGELQPGEIAVLDKRTSKYFTGVYATRKICLHVPIYYLFGLLLYIPPIKNIVGKNKVGCNGETCDIKKTT